MSVVLIVGGGGRLQSQATQCGYVHVLLWKCHGAVFCKHVLSVLFSFLAFFLLHF